MEPQEQNIIQECQKGRLERFAELYDIYVSKIYRFIYYKTSHRETAEDITSEVFVKVISRINSFDANKGSFNSWIYKIARNSVIDYYRMKKDTRNIEDVPGISQQSAVFDNLYKQEKFKQAQKALNLLSPGQREIVVLRVWENMPYQQIAELVGSTEGACKMAFSRAIKILRQSMPITLVIILLFSIINNQ